MVLGEAGNACLKLFPKTFIYRAVGGDTRFNPESLPENLASRPGRFDKLIKIDDPSDETRRLYLESLGIKVDKELLKDTKGFSIAYLREIFLSSKINDTSIMHEIIENKKRLKLVQKSFAESSENKIGLS